MRNQGEVDGTADPYGFAPAALGGLNRHRLAMGAAVLGILGFAGIILFAYDRGSRSNSGDGPPLIEADTQPTKMRPEQPGGMEVPHQDKLVYDRLNPQTSRPSVEKLLPPPEQPLPRPVVTPQLPPPPSLPSLPALGSVPTPQVAAAVPGVAEPPPGATTTVPRSLPAAPQAGGRGGAAGAGELAQANGAPPAAGPPARATTTTVTVKPAAAPKTPPAPAPVATMTAPPKASPAPAPTVAAMPPAPPKAAVAAAPAKAAPSPATAPAVPAPVAVVQAAAPAPPPPAAAKAAPAPPAASGGGGSGWRVQLAAVHSEVEAQAEWKRLVQRFPDHLSGLRMQAVRADLGEKGIFFRVQAGGIDEEKARSVCTHLKAQSVGCVIVRP
jgi:hypothetical protein